jgi:hypothetical protein
MSDWLIPFGFVLGYGVAGPLLVLLFEDLSWRLHVWRHRNEPPPDPLLFRQFHVQLKERYK